MPTNLRFPLDLGQEQLGHMMKIGVYPWKGPGQDFQSSLNQALTGNIGDAIDSAINTYSPNADFNISLFVPGGATNGALEWRMVHDYDEVKLTKLGMGVVGAVSKVAEGVADIAMRGARVAGMGTINPKVDVLYSNSQLRKFMFTHFMVPSSEQENRRMEEIIRSLRAYSAPYLTMAPGGEAGVNQDMSVSQLRTGYWFLPPAEFDIGFYYLKDGRITINPHMPRIGRCVLEAIDVNYSQQGDFSAYGDGAPTAAQLTMQFREMRVITQTDVERGY